MLSCGSKRCCLHPPLRQRTRSVVVRSERRGTSGFTVSTVDTIKKPVGPEPEAVYWRRRIILIAAVLGVVALLAWLWPSGGQSEPAALPSTSASPSKSASSASASASPSASASGEASPSEAGETSPAGDAQQCRGSDLDVTVSVETPAPTAGSEVVFVMSVANTGDSPCTQDVGAAATTFTVTSGGFRVWSSDDCNPGGSEQLEVIPPGQAFAVQAVWPTIITTPGCPTTDNPARPGSYDVTATDAGITSAATRFVLN